MKKQRFTFSGFDMWGKPVSFEEDVTIYNRWERFVHWLRWHLHIGRPKTIIGIIIAPTAPTVDWSEPNDPTNFNPRHPC